MPTTTFIPTSASGSRWHGSRELIAFVSTSDLTSGSAGTSAAPHLNLRRRHPVHLAPVPVRGAWARRRGHPSGRLRIRIFGQRPPRTRNCLVMSGPECWRSAGRLAEMSADSRGQSHRDIGILRYRAGAGSATSAEDRDRTAPLPMRCCVRRLARAWTTVTPIGITMGDTRSTMITIVMRYDDTFDSHSPPRGLGEF